VGDFIDAGGTMGIVKEIGILVTLLDTPDNKRIIAPNSSIMGGVITNFSHNDTRRVDMVYGVSYSDDLDKVIALLENICKADERVLEDPAPQVAVLSHGDSSVNLVCRPWVKKEDYWDIFFGFHKLVKQEFDKAGISIPFPQHDLHIVEDTTKSA
jgi:small conductance mechanosensitive channel